MNTCTRRLQTRPEASGWLSSRWWVAGVLSLALALRLWVAVAGGNAPPVSDGVEYDGYAVNLLSGKGYQLIHEGTLRRSDRLPLYPLLLAGFYSVFGRWFAPVRIFQALLGALTVWLLFRWGNRILARPVALLGGLLAAVYPAFLWYYGPGFILTETVFIFTIVLAMERASALVERPTAGRAAGLGLALGAAALTKGAGGLFFGFVLGYLAAFSEGSWRRKGLRLGLALLVFMACLAPWLVRNYLVHGRFVYSTKGGHVFWESNNPTARGGWAPVNPQDQDRQPGLSERQTAYLAQREAIVRAHAREVRAIEARHPAVGLLEADADKEERAKGFDFLLSYPRRVPKLLFRKLVLLWNPIGQEFFLGYGLILPYAILGLWAARSLPGVGLLWVGVLYFNAIALLFYGHPRFRLFFEPFLLLAASAGLWTAARTCRSRPGWLAAPVLLLAVTLWMASDVDRALGLFRGAFSILGLR
ncbi:MAG: ArnT family glycosyltransferase [Nitrospinota bacterium]